MSVSTTPPEHPRLLSSSPFPLDPPQSTSLSFSAQALPPPPPRYTFKREGGRQRSNPLLTFRTVRSSSTRAQSSTEDFSAPNISGEKKLLFSHSSSSGGGRHRECRRRKERKKSRSNTKGTFDTLRQRKGRRATFVL